MHKDQSEIIRAICANYSFGRMYQNGVVENNGAFFFLFLVASSVWFLFFFLFMLVAYQEIVLALRAPKVYKTFSYGTQEAKIRACGDAHIFMVKIRRAHGKHDR